MIKKYLLLSALSGMFLFSCNTDDDTPRDMDAPVIAAAEGRPEIRPRQGERMPATNDHMHVRFSVTDPSGIRQIRMDVHSGFDGHTHGRMTQGFEPLVVSRVIELDGATYYNQDGHDTDIYWEGANSEIDGNVLAGPYHFGLDATDIHGNVTSYADNNNYSATFYLERPYAPDMNITNLDGDELEGEPGEALDVQGTIHRRDHELSSDITFLWVRLVEEDDHDDDDDHGHGEDVYEAMWGQSTWRQHSNGNWYSGDDIPSGASINLADVLSGNNAIQLPAGDHHYELIIWAEDANGNVTRRAYEVHAH